MSYRLGLLLPFVIMLGCARGASEALDISASPVRGDSGQDAARPDAASNTSDASARNDAAMNDAASRADAGRDAGPSCGDATCQTSESCMTCAADCGACPPAHCGDGTCQSSETCGGCAVDCGSCGGVSGTDCGTCSLLTFGRESDCIGNTLYRCFDGACLVSEPCGSRTCMRVNDKATCQ